MGADGRSHYPSHAAGLEKFLPASLLAGTKRRWFQTRVRISHTLSAAARDTAMSTSLRSVTVLNVLFQYASAR